MNSSSSTSICQFFHDAFSDFSLLVHRPKNSSLHLRHRTHPGLLQFSLSCPPPPLQDSVYCESMSPLKLILIVYSCFFGGAGSFPGGAVVENLPTDTEGAWDTGSIPRSERAPGVGNGNPFQYSCLENSTDRGAWQSMGLQRVRHDWARTHTHPHSFFSA